MTEADARETSDVISQDLIDDVCRRIRLDQRVRRALPAKGRLHIDRQLPFLCVYRRPADSVDSGTRRLVTGEASYLVASGALTQRGGVTALVESVAKTMVDAFGAFLIVELWAVEPVMIPSDDDEDQKLPCFAIHDGQATGPAIDELAKNLARIRLLNRGMAVVTDAANPPYPAHLGPLLQDTDIRHLGCSLLGLAVPAIYRDTKSGREFPLVLRALRRQLGLALRRTFFTFARSSTKHRPRHFHTLGRRAVVKAVWQVDRRLAAVSNQFDYLLQLTPTNTREVWRRSEGGRFSKTPQLHYRPLPIDPAVVKRELYAIPIERIEDPALQSLFEEKQAELDLKLTMLRDRNTRRFMYESLQLFGGVDNALFEVAANVLSELSPGGGPHEAERVDAVGFAKRADAELRHYQQIDPRFAAKTRIRNDVTGLMVSRGKLLIGSDLSVRPSRVEALLAHEVSTHALTYFNGRAQPFQQLYAGLAGYEALQEGLAVFAEYVVGGLSPARLRLLAGRVVAVCSLIDGGNFVDTYRRLHTQFAFSKRAAYGMTVRVYRGGGLTKDAIYLRGLRALLRYIEDGGDLDILWVGKMALEHVPLMRELQLRGVLRPTPNRPRFLKHPLASDRIERLRGGVRSVLELVCREPRAEANAT